MPSVKFVDANGNDIETINRDQGFRVEVDLGRTDGPDTLDVVFRWDDGDESDTFTITRMPDGKYSSALVTARHGGKGGGTITFAGFATSTGDVGTLDVEAGEYLTVAYGDCAARVRVFDTYVQQGLHLNRLFISQVSAYYTVLAINLTSVIGAFEKVGEGNLDDEGRQLLGLARQGLAIATTGIAMAGRAIFYLNNDEMLDTQRYYISNWYVNRLKGDFDPAVTGDPNYMHSLVGYDQRDEYTAIAGASERGRQHTEDVMWRQLGLATLGAYRVLVNASGAAQVMTLFGTNEMGGKAKGWERLVAFFDLVGQAALMGAIMHFQVTHTVGRTQPPLGRSTAAVDPKKAATGVRIDPTSAGMTDAAARQAQLVARKHGVHILTRQSGAGVAELRTQGFTPKPEAIKAKTINELDVHLGAPETGLRQAALFKPKMPETRPAGMDDATWGKLGERYSQRLEEYNGPTGDKIRMLAEQGLVDIRDGVIHDTGLVTGSGKPITGDYDLFEIVFPDGTPVPVHVYNAVVADLTLGPFQAMHGAHMRWDIQMGDWSTFAEFVHCADVFDTNLGIYNKIIRTHYEEPLIVFGGDRPPYALTSDATPPIKLGDLRTGLPGGDGFSPMLFKPASGLRYPAAGLNYGALPFLDADEAAQLQAADDDWYRWQGETYDVTTGQFGGPVGTPDLGPSLTPEAGARRGFFRTPPGHIALGAAVAVAAGLTVGGLLLFAGGKGPVMDVNPGQGPDRTTATITVTGALPNAPVTVSYTNHSPDTGNTDANGKVTFSQTFTGQPGDVIQIEAVIGPANDQTVRGSFTITGEEEGEEPVGGVDQGEEPVQPSVSVDPAEGPSGTTATISVTGEPNASVTLRIGGQAVTTGRTDAQGSFSYSYQFFGQPDEEVPVEAQVGQSADSPKAQATFTITGLTDGAYLSAFTVAYDEGGHRLFVGMPDTLTLWVRFGSIVVEGPDPFVAVSGEVEEDGSFMASGAGVVAGFPNVTVTFEGTVTSASLTGEYTMGAGGELPGGEPIVFEVTGEREEESALSAEVVGFYDEFNAAQAAGDAAGLAALLHPAVLERYGAEACDAYLESIVNPTVMVEPVAESGVGDWLWERDGVSSLITDAYTLTVRVTVEGAEPTEQEAHLALRDDGTLGWFTDCGDPLG